VLCLLALPARGLAQDATTNNTNTSRAATAETGDTGFVARMRARFDRLQERGVHPKAGTIVSGSSLAFGVEFRRPTFGGSPIGGSVEARWSLRGYQEYGAQLGWVEHQRDTLQLAPALSNVTSLFNDRKTKVAGRAAYLDVRYYRHPQVAFFGIGDNLPVTRTDFSVSGISADGVVQWQPTTRLGVSARAGLLDLDTGPGTDDSRPNLEEIFTVAQAPGLQQRARYITAGIGAAHDTRDRTAVPTMGTFLGASIRQFMPINTDAEAFTRLGFDGRFYRPLPTTRQVLAVSLIAVTDQSGNNSPTPFYLQQSLGGGRTLRGFQTYRFRGESLVHLSIEYRWRVAKYIDLAPFIDVGDAATRFSDLSTGRAHATPGFGIRARDDKRFYARLDWAKGPDGHRLIISLNPPF
jgi:outer membrane protein assembly factor BamA